MSFNLIPHSPTPLAELLSRAAFAPLDHLGWIRVTGEDRVRWLNGMVTNSIQSLKPGEGCYNFFLNAQGRIQGDCTAWMLEDSILLETSADRIPALMALLDHFIIMDDVELEVLPDLQGILIAGRETPSIVQALGSAGEQVAPCATDAPTPSAVATQSPNLKQTAYAGAPVSLIQAASPLIFGEPVPCFEVWSDPATLAAIVDELRGTQALAATPADLERLRILSGTPLYGTDIRNTDAHKDLPQETASAGTQSRALHFAKGCYLGQEIVERIRSRGAVHRTFSGFLLTGDLPAPGTILTSDDKPVGELTSVTTIDPGLLANPENQLEGATAHIALGYIRREALDRKASLTYPGGTATPSPLPFPLAHP